MNLFITNDNNYAYETVDYAKVGTTTKPLLLQQIIYTPYFYKLHNFITKGKYSLRLLL